jgi:hypothetical protein
MALTPEQLAKAAQLNERDRARMDELDEALELVEDAARQIRRRRDQVEIDMELRAKAIAKEREAP